MYPITISIDEGHYGKLLSDSQLLAALMAEGVDNWEGYSRAVKAINDTPVVVGEVLERQDAAVDTAASAK